MNDDNLCVCGEKMIETRSNDQSIFHVCLECTKKKNEQFLKRKRNPTPSKSDIDSHEDEDNNKEKERRKKEKENKSYHKYPEKHNSYKSKIMSILEKRKINVNLDD